MTPKKVAEKKAKVGRPPRKDRTGIPKVSPMDAINAVKRAYQEIGTKVMSFEGMAKAMGMKSAYAKFALGIITENYGLIVQDNGWRISDLGSRVAEDNKSAVLEVIQKVENLRELYEVSKDANVDKSFLEEHINKKRKGYKAADIVGKFLEVMVYVNGLKTAGSRIPVVGATSASQWLKLMQLKYALEPPKTEEISTLADEVSNELIHDDDPAIMTLAKQLKDNIKHTNNLKLLAASLESIFLAKHPELAVREKKKKSTTEPGDI